jgi:hypothetical protein
MTTFDTKSLQRAGGFLLRFFKSSSFVPLLCQRRRKTIFGDDVDNR